AYVLARAPDFMAFVLGRGEVPGEEVSDAAIAFSPAFYAHYEPEEIDGRRAAHRAWLPHATEAQARQLAFLAGLRRVPSTWGAAFRADSPLRFVVYRRVAAAATAGDPVRATFAALEAAATAGDWARALALARQSTTLDAAGLGMVRAGLEARYAAR